MRPSGVSGKVELGIVVVEEDEDAAAATGFARLEERSGRVAALLDEGELVVVGGVDRCGSIAAWTHAAVWASRSCSKFGSFREGSSLWHTQHSSSSAMRLRRW